MQIGIVQLVFSTYILCTMLTCFQRQNCTLKESVAVLEDRLCSAQTGDSRRRELERHVSSLQAEVIAKDRTLKSQYQQIQGGPKK